MQYKTAGMNEDQKRFVKIFERLTYRQSDWQAWADFVTIAAYSIANAVDRSEKQQKREELYNTIADRYKPEEIDLFAQMFADVVDALEKNPNQDYLGELFMALELGSHWHGQFFTPYCVCEMMAKMQITENERAKIEEKRVHIGERSRVRRRGTPRRCRQCFQRGRNQLSAERGVRCAGY
jgi:type I restriction-modification system DNA methylase subunit